MLRQALGDRVVPDAESFLDMLAEDAVMDFPFAAPGLPARLEGSTAIADHLRNFAAHIALTGVGAAIVHAEAESGFVVLEFEAEGRGTATGEPYQQKYVSVIRTRDGRIAHYRDYWNPLAILRTLKGPAVERAFVADWADHD